MSELIVQFEEPQLQSAARSSDSDALTAPLEAVPTKSDAGPSLRDCARVFVRQPSPPYLFGALALAVAARAVQGHFSWRDLVMVAGLFAVTPFVEWAIHVYLLHARPFTLFGHKIEMLSAREHRAHHEAPTVLAGVLIPLYAVLLFLVAIAAVNWALSFPIDLVIGGPRLAYATTGVATSFAILSAYEWTHFLIHTPHRARSRYYRAIWRNHRLHHYKNEHYWFGVTSTVGDRVIGTLADQRSIPRSATARSLHPDL
ncbi:MAG TPA: sterol desaturase family protein [Solirubrobacteraceae bacterium]|nr:sterol desaturase family protein [Solirubrobacteraceae bacterium]